MSKRFGSTDAAARLHVSSGATQSGSKDASQTAQQSYTKSVERSNKRIGALEAENVQLRQTLARKTGMHATKVLNSSKAVPMVSAATTTEPLPNEMALVTSARFTKTRCRQVRAQLNGLALIYGSMAHHTITTVIHGVTLMRSACTCAGWHQTFRATKQRGARGAPNRSTRQLITAHEHVRGRQPVRTASLTSSKAERPDRPDFWP
jgi:hypothetical protein